MSVLTPNGNLSSKVSAGRTYKRYLRIQRIVRLSCQVPPLTDEEIAISQGVTKQYVSMLRRSPEYQALQVQLFTGVIAQENRHLFENLEENQDLIKAFIPEAMQALYETLMDRQNPALRLKAAESILDREGSLAKISKTEIKKKVEFDFAGQDAIAGDLLAALKANEVSSEDDRTEIQSDFAKSASTVNSDANKLDAALDLLDQIDKLKPATDTVQ